jgi:hypothetical protein
MAFGVTFQIKELFFDRPAIQLAADRASRKVLSKAGAFVRRRARSSIRRRKGTSPAGGPPYAHSKDNVATLKNILFGYDPAAQSVVIGPLRLNQYHYLGPQLRAGTVPQLHEFGGRIGFREKRVGKRWVASGRRRPRPGQPVRVRIATYPARPFMGPALEKEAPNFPTLFHNSIRAA